MHANDYRVIAAALKKVRETWGLTDNVNTRDEALFNDVVDSISRALGRDNSSFSPERFNAAVYGSIYDRDPQAYKDSIPNAYQEPY